VFQPKFINLSYFSRAARTAARFCGTVWQGNNTSNPNFLFFAGWFGLNRQFGPNKDHLKEARFETTLRCTLVSTMKKYKKLR